MLKKFAALLSLVGVLAGTGLITLLVRFSGDWEQVGGFLQKFWIPLAAGSGVFLLTTLVAAMAVLFAPKPLPPGPDPETLAALKRAQDKIIDLQTEVDEGEKRQIAFQGEAARSQAEVIDLNARLSHLNAELATMKEREGSRPDPAVAERQIRDLSDQLARVTEKFENYRERQAAQGDPELAQLQIRELKDQVTQLTAELETLKERDAALTESEEAQRKARELARQVPQLTKELAAQKEREDAMVNELDRAKERAAELNSELVQMADRKKALTAERDDLQRQLAELREAQAAPAGAAEKFAPDAAFQILFLLQKEGRLLDFLSEDLSGVDDEGLGGAIRPIHESLRKILQDRLVIEPVLAEPEGEEVALGETVDPDRIKLTGNVPPKGPYRGVLVHRGWRLKSCKLPELVSGWTGDVIVPAEVEIS